MNNSFAKFFSFLLGLWMVMILGLLFLILIAIKDLSENRDWPERVTEINHIKWDVSVTDGGNVLLPEEEIND